MNYINEYFSKLIDLFRKESKKPIKQIKMIAINLKDRVMMFPNTLTYGPISASLSRLINKIMYEDKIVIEKRADFTEK